ETLSATSVSGAGCYSRHSARHSQQWHVSVVFGPAALPALGRKSIRLIAAWQPRKTDFRGRFARGLGSGHRPRQGDRALTVYQRTPGLSRRQLAIRKTSELRGRHQFLESTHVWRLIDERR